MDQKNPLKDSSCSRWELTPRPTLDNIQKVRCFWKLSTKWDAFINDIPTGIRELCQRGGQKILRARRDRWHQGSNIGLPYTNCTHRDCVSIHSLQLQARLGSHSSEWAKWIWVAVSNQEVISNWQLLTKEELVFHSAVSLGIFATLKGVPIPSSRQPMPNNLNGISGDFVSHIALSTFPLPYWSLLVCFSTVWF